MSPATWWAAVYEDTAEAVAAWLAGNRLAGSPSAANYFLNLVTDSTPIRHCREKFDILFENLHQTAPVSPRHFGEPRQV
jgi:hypothetical protein